MTTKLLRPKEAAERVGLHSVHLRRLEKRGKFPASVVIGANAIAYVEAEVAAWIDARIAERDNGTAVRPTGPKAANSAP